MPRRRLAALIALLALPLALVAADSATEIALQRKLDAPIDLELDKLELSKAFEEIAGKAGIALQVDPNTYELLPYGSTTRVSASFRSSKLRDAIDEILRPLALEKTVSGATVIITPTAPLARIGRRATWEELNVLQQARSQNLTALNKADWTANLRPILGIGSLGVELATPTGPAHEAGMEQVRKQLPTTVWNALDIYSAATKQIWFVNGTTIKVMPQRQWLEQQLLRRVEIHKTNRPLQEIVSELAHLSGIHFTPEPGLYMLFPGVTLNSTNGTVREVLDTLVGAIGISYELRDDSLYIRQARGPATTTAPRGGDPIVGQIQVPLGDGSNLLMFVRESDLPGDVSQARKKRLQEAIDAMRRSLEPKPATTSGPRK